MSKMLHNNYMEIFKHFSGDVNLGHYGRELSKNMSFSQKKVSYILKNMEQRGILRSNLIGKVRQYRINIDNSSIRDYILISEIHKKVEFLDKNSKLANIFTDDKRIVGIFGSFSKNLQTKSSDVDIFIIGDKNGFDYGLSGKTFDFNIHLTIFSEKEAETLLKEKNCLMREIIESHILISQAERFINLIWGSYYGFIKMVQKEEKRDKTDRTKSKYF